MKGKYIESLLLHFEDIELTAPIRDWRLDDRHYYLQQVHVPQRILCEVICNPDGPVLLVLAKRKMYLLIGADSAYQLLVFYGDFNLGQSVEK